MGSLNLAEVADALRACLPDLEHYAATHGPGPDVRLRAAREALARYEKPQAEKPKLGTGWVCLACGREWSAMMGDNEVPEECPDCGGEVEEGRAG